VDEAYAWAEQAAEDHPDFVQWIDIGDSWEKENGRTGHDLHVMIFTNRAIEGEKPKFFLDGNMHAREIATGGLAQAFADTLLNKYGVDPDVTWIIDHHEVHVCFFQNPDGRIQAQAGKLWRKNMNEDYCCASCDNRGCDLNRNYSIGWGNIGSTDQCASDFRGIAAFSEPETKSVSEYLKSIFPDQNGNNPNNPVDRNTATGVWINLHQYMRVIYHPSSFPGGADVTTLARKLAYFNRYDPQGGGGTAQTWGYGKGELGIMSMLFEVGTAFFQDCPTYNAEIIPRNMPALMYAAKVCRTPYVTPYGPDALSVAVVEDTVAQGTGVALSATLDNTRYSSNPPNTAVEEAEYHVDIPPWSEDPAPEAFPMDAADGNFNSAEEDAAAEIATGGLEAGRHIIFVRGKNSANVWGPVSAVFLEVEAPSSGKRDFARWNTVVADRARAQRLAAQRLKSSIRRSGLVIVRPAAPAAQHAPVYDVRGRMLARLPASQAAGLPGRQPVRLMLCK
jgi:hypothetical protein